MDESDNKSVFNEPPKRSQSLRYFLRFLAFSFSVLVVMAGVYIWYAGTVGNDEFRKICEEQAGVKVYRKASAEGYFDNGLSCLHQGCWDTLLKSGYRFIETSYPSMLRANEGPMRYYRYEVVSRDDPRCSQRFLDDLKNKKYYARVYGETDVCVAEEEIDGVMARYERFSGRLPAIVLDNSFESTVARNYMAIKDRKQNSIVVEQTVPMLSRRSLPSFSSFGTVVNCSRVGVDDGLPPANWISRYLDPI